MLSGLSPQDKKKIKLVVFAILLLLGVWMIWSPYGLKKAMETRNDLKSVHEKNKLLREKNSALEEEITRLKSDPKYVEEIARKKHGMVKENEMVFEFEEK